MAYSTIKSPRSKASPVASQTLLILDPWLAKAVQAVMAEDSTNLSGACRSLLTAGLDSPVPSFFPDDLPDPWDVLRVEFPVPYAAQREKVQVGFMAPVELLQLVHALQDQGAPFHTYGLPDVHRYLLAYAAAKRFGHGTF